MSCCGGNHPEDWFPVFKEDSFPDSCCSGTTRYPVIRTVDFNVTESTPTEDGHQCTSSSNGLFRTSCQQAIEEYVQSNVTNLIITVSVFLIVQVLSLVASCSMARSTRKQYYRFV